MGYCGDQGEHFTISCKSLLKVLAEEGLIETFDGQHTKSMRLDGKSSRVVMDKYKAKVTVEVENPRLWSGANIAPG